ncbi:MAG TPA: PIG-L family deacetylase [Gemmatimonadaceae bacterium]|nr:PIG-L family deacetylase [Gemmatimonadaceae bacterium]
MIRSLALLAALACSSLDVEAQTRAAPIRVLTVVAHPDDETDFVGAVYKLTHVLGGKADLCIITNGEGGYRYATLAEPIYGLKLTQESVGRKALPAIRKREARASGAITGISNFYFLDQFDKAYTLDVNEVLKSQWDTAFVRRRLAQILNNGHYDFVLVSEPSKTTHGAHQAAALMAVSAVAAMPANRRPVILATNSYKKGDPPPNYTGRDDFPFAAARPIDPPLEFDLTMPFGYQDKLDYRIVGNWVIAEHKSQGVMQIYMNTFDTERFFLFAIDNDAAVAKTKALFAKLNDRSLKP